MRFEINGRHTPPSGSPRAPELIAWLVTAALLLPTAIVGAALPIPGIQRLQCRERERAAGSDSARRPSQGICYDLGQHCRLPYDSVSVFGTRSGNPDLEPITADVWNAGVVWAPINNLSLSVDYYNWKIKNEVDTLSSDQLLLAEYYCRNGQVQQHPGQLPERQ